MDKSTSVVMKDIHWSGHAGFKIGGKRIVYIDPFQLGFPEVGDVILITHHHANHCSPADVKWLRKGSTVIVAPEACADQFRGDIRVVGPGDEVTIKGVEIEVVPAYNLDAQHHPKSARLVGYLITTPSGHRIYHAGDTDLIPEMDEVSADIALLPVGGTYTMDAAEAAMAANRIRPKVAVPMHWGTSVGSREDAERFRELCEVDVRILKVEK